MPDLIDDVLVANQNPYLNRDQVRKMVLAVADWLDAPGDEVNVQNLAAARLRAEVAPPPPPTAEDVIRSVGTWASGEEADAIAAALRDAGLLREDTP